MKSPNLNRKWIAAVISLGLIPQAVNAQIEEVLVTAQKRTQSSQDVPISISAMPAAQLKAMAIEGMDELRFAVPGLQMDRRVNSEQIHLRGIGTPATSSGQESSVAVYTDGVYNPSPNTNVVNFNNVERVEVLKGPQGTLFGRNATGGVIHIITKTPSKEPSLDVSLGYAKYDDFEAKLYGTTGIGDSIAADLAVFYKDQSDGYITNRFDGSKVGTEKDIALRSKWLIEFGEHTDLMLTANYAKTEGDVGMFRQPVHGTVGVGGFVPVDDFYSVTSDWPGDFEHEFESYSAKFRHEFENFDFVSISAYLTESDDYNIDTDATDAPIIQAFLHLDLDTYTQEFQLVSNNDSKLTWIVGFYYFDTASDYAPLDLKGLAIPSVLGSIAIYSTLELQSYAGFIDGTYDLSDDTTVTAGVRYTKDKLKLFGRTRFTAFPPAAWPPAYDENIDFDEPTWRVGLDHRISEDVMAYAMYSRGYKTGMYNTVVSSGSPAAPVEPEIVDAYELGFKGEFLDRTLQVNGAMFINKATDLQVFTNVPGGTILSNAAKATIKGIELTVLSQPTDRLDMHLALSLMDSEFDEFPNTDLFPPNVDEDGNRTGGNQGGVFGDLNRLRRAPYTRFNHYRRDWLPDPGVIRRDQAVRQPSPQWRPFLGA